jgi:hypothetical protein
MCLMIAVAVVSAARAQATPPLTQSVLDSNDLPTSDHPVLHPQLFHRHYRLMREHQTVEFYKRMEQKYSFEGGRCRARMTIREVGSWACHE